MTSLTPVEERNGLVYKREDLFRLPNGVNGSKLRACYHLIERAADAGASTIVSASSVLSPQAAMSATVAADFGLSSITFVGGTTPEKARKHASIRLAAETGSEVRTIAAVGFNPTIQAAADRFVGETEGAWKMPYGISVPNSDGPAAVEAFLRVGGEQVANLPDEIEDLVVPFGSGNTLAGILYGLDKVRIPAGLRRLHLPVIGPDREAYVAERLRLAGAAYPDVEVVKYPIHPDFATYGRRMPETADGIRFHPTYEGKIVRYFNLTAPEFWTRRDGRTALWIVGGPL